MSRNKSRRKTPFRVPSHANQEQKLNDPPLRTQPSCEVPFKVTSPLPLLWVYMYMCILRSMYYLARFFQTMTDSVDRGAEVLEGDHLRASTSCNPPSRCANIRHIGSRHIWRELNRKHMAAIGEKREGARMGEGEREREREGKREEPGVRSCIHAVPRYHGTRKQPVFESQTFEKK